MLMGIPHPGMTNRFRRFRNPRGLHHCLRFYALGPDSEKPTDKEPNRMDIHLRSILGRLRLCLLLGRPLLQFTNQTMPARSIFRGNIHLPRLVAGTAPRILLPISATLLLDFHIHRRGSQRSRTTLTFLTRHHRATQDHPISHHPVLRSILRRQTRDLGIHL